MIPRCRPDRPAAWSRLSIGNRLADMAGLPAFVTAVSERAGVDEGCADIMNVVLDELVNNTITHGYPEGATGRIEVALRVCGARFCAEITSDASPFVPGSIAAPTPTPALSDWKVGGLGLHLVRSLVKEISFERHGDTNVTTLWVTNEPV